MIIEDLKQFANTIKHSGDYGALWVKDKSVIWVAGDADFDPDEINTGICSSMDYIIDGFKSLGAENVEIEAEWEPDESDGWVFLGRFGIDNWHEKKVLTAGEFREKYWGAAFPSVLFDQQTADKMNWKEVFGF